MKKRVFKQRSARTLATEALVIKLNAGKLNAEMGALVENIGRMISARLVHHRIVRSDWRDMHQQCWLVIWKRLAKWKSKEGAISSYVYQAVDSVVGEQQRKHMRRIERENDCGALENVTGKRMM